MKSLRSILALCAFFVLAAGLSACGGAVPGNSVADMAGNPVSTQAFNHWMYVAAKGNASQSPGAPVIVPNDPPDFKSCIAQVRKQIPSLAKTTDKQVKIDCARLFTSLSTQVLGYLIKTYWFQAEAAKQHITVTDAEVQQAFQTAKKAQFPTDSAFQTFLTQTGQTMQDILFRFRVNQTYKKLLAKHPSAVTTAQIQAYYSSHGSQFGTPASRDVRIIRTRGLTPAKAAKAALASGQSWKSVAAKYSVDPATKSNGGLTTGLTPGQQEQAVDKVVFSAPLNKLFGPIRGLFGTYLVEVVKITPATRQTLEKATPLIKQLLQSQLQQTAQAAVNNQVKKDWLHKTQCRSAYAMAECNGYKAPQATTPVTPTPTPTPAPTPTPPTTTTKK